MPPIGRPAQNVINSVETRKPHMRRTAIDMHRILRTLRLAAATVLLAGACGARATSPAPTTPAPAPIADARFTAADVRFMTGMITHHAQAIVMSEMAPSHDASSALQVLAGRIINAQKDEIAAMQQWLRDRNQPVPEPAPGGHDHHAGHHDMPGMLSAEQLQQLDAARGQEFDRLFLKFMIEHHRGAITMVEQLLQTPGAAQHDATFKIVSDINVDQATEIERMQNMLFDLFIGKEDE